MKRIKGLCNLPDFLVSDPCYGADCKYRYHKPSRLNSEVEFCVKEVYYQEYDYTALNLDLTIVRRRDELIPKPFLLLNSNGDCCHTPWLRKREIEIGVDSASLFIGTTAHYDEDNVIHTGGDGGLGSLYEFFIRPGTAVNQPDGTPAVLKSGFYGIQLALSFSPSVVSEDNLAQYLISNLNIMNYEEV